MKKLLFMFALIYFLCLGSIFSKSKKVIGVSEKPDLKYEYIDPWTYRITGTEGLSDVCLLFDFYLGKKGFKKSLEINKNEVLDNVSVVIEDVTYQLKFKKSHNLHAHEGMATYVLEFSLDIDKNVNLILPNSILIQAKRSLPYILKKEDVGTEVKYVKSNFFGETYILRRYGPKKPPYTCCYVKFFANTKALYKTREEAEIDNKKYQEKKEKENLRKDLIKRILKKMGYREVNSIGNAIMKGDIVLSNGGLNNPFRMFIQDVSFNGSMFSYLVATGYSQNTLNLLGGDIFYIVSSRQLKHTDTFRRGDEITENLCLEYIGTDTYRHGNTIEECKVFSITSENERKTIVDVINNPEKYKYLLE